MKSLFSNLRNSKCLSYECQKSQKIPRYDNPLISLRYYIFNDKNHTHSLNIRLKE